jgi:YD repeat-containing protein
MASINRGRFVADRGGTRQRRILWRLPVRSLALTLVLFAPSGAWAQQANINYVYDDFNRLSAVVDQQGNVATYSYDLAGNLLAIGRVNASSIPGPVGITLVAPNIGPVTTTSVAIYGKGFSATPTDNTVLFNGTAAAVTAAAPNRLAVTVPIGATTGLITVTTPSGSAMSPSPFAVVGVIAVSPAAVAVALAGTQQFTATEGGTPTTAVTWAVNGVTGGDSSIGTISAAGLYTAPTIVPAAFTVTVSATRQGDRTSSGSGQVSILGFSLGVDRNAGASNVSVTVTADQAFVAALPVSVSLLPVITGVAPPSAPRGTMNLTVTLTGSGFTGATGVSVFLNNAPDPNISVGAPTVVSDAQATVVLSIASGAVVGDRVVQISTPGGTSTRAGTGGNLFTVQ